jgi:hypothetical protein
MSETVLLKWAVQITEHENGSVLVRVDDNGLWLCMTFTRQEWKSCSKRIMKAVTQAHRSLAAFMPKDVPTWKYDVETHRFNIVEKSA